MQGALDNAYKWVKMLVPVPYPTRSTKLVSEKVVVMIYGNYINVIIIYSNNNNDDDDDDNNNNKRCCYHLW